MEEQKWTDDDIKKSNEDIDESKDAKLLRKLILNIDDVEYELLKNGNNEEKNKVIEKISNDDNCILNLLTNEEWKNFENTLTMPIKGNNAEEKLNNAYESAGQIIKNVEKFVFDSEISSYVKKFYSDLEKSVKGRIIPGTYKFNGFGMGSGMLIRTIPAYLQERLKKIFVDSSRNEGMIFKSIPIDRIYRSIPEDIFWQNAAVINCVTSDAYNNIIRAVGDIGRDELNIQQKLISTGLETNTLVYTLTPNDSKVNLTEIKDRKGEKLFKEGELSIHDKRILMNVKRKYFIIVTEGLIKKGKLLSKIGNTISKLSNKTSGNSNISHWNSIK